MTKSTEPSHRNEAAIRAFGKFLGRLRSFSAAIDLLLRQLMDLTDDGGPDSGEDVGLERRFDSSLGWYTWCCSECGCSFNSNPEFGLFWSSF